MHVAGVDWRLDLDYRAKTFSGTVSIEIEGANGTVALDAARLTVDSARLDGVPVPWREDRAKETLEFTGVSAQPHRLEISYRGSVEPNSLIGPYVSPCGSGYALTTMMFPTGSRRLLPAFEHPSMKTVYRLVLTVDPDVRVIFNTAPRSERAVDGRRELTYEPTPPMSVYLLYLGIGPFDAYSSQGHRWSVTVATSPGRAPAGRFCAERSTELLAAYEEYYGVAYPLPKLDLVALENFWAGAMENWGAIAFRESAVLVDPMTSAQARRNVLVILAHEIAHQWFGNLVTPAAWDDFWLNESFATFVGFRIVARRYPEEEALNYLLIRWFGPALEQDSLHSTHPIRVPVSGPEALGEVSDEVTYGKGAAVLRMIEAYLGEETFRRGVSRYLDRHRYANARAEDLWTALDEVSGQPVSRVMTEWITRPGYPIVHARWARGRLDLRQEQFHADGTSSKATWPIPMRVVTGEGERTILLENPATTIATETPRGLRINPGRTAFVRVAYDAALFDTLVAELSSMEPTDQWGLIIDTQALVYAGLTPLTGFLQLVEAGTSLNALAPVQAMANALGDLHRPLHDFPPFLAAARKFLAAQLARIGLEPALEEPPSSAILRQVLAQNLVGVDPAFARTLAPRFAEFDRLPPELQAPVAEAFASAGGTAAWEPLLDRLASATREAERGQMLRALGAFRDPALVRRSLDLVPGPRMTAGMALELLVGVAANPASGRELFDWFRARAGPVTEMWAGTPLLSLYLRAALTTMGLDQEGPVEQYFREHPPRDAARGIEQGLESLRIAARLRRTALGSRPA